MMKKTKIIFAAVATMGMLMLTACGKDDNTGGATRYTLTVQPNNPDWGTAIGSGTYPDGTNVAIEAVPATGYYFIKWSDGAVSNPRMVTVSRDMTFYALFSNRQNDPNPYNPGDNPTPGPQDWVDLGLPSGLLWAKCNLGATSPEEYGNYYAWGETTTKEVYDWSTYAYGNSSCSLTKYCDNAEYGLNGFTDNLTTLQAMDDAATAALGSGARTPTIMEWQELINNTTVEWTTMNGVNGRKFTSTANGNTLFLPAAGGRYGSELYYAGSYGNYWSSSLLTDYPDYAWRFYFSSDDRRTSRSSRYNGFSFRAVRQN